MELLRLSDLQVYADVANNLEAPFFARALQLSKTMLEGQIGLTCVAAIEALDREKSTDTAKALYQFWFNAVRPYMAYTTTLHIIDLYPVAITNGGIISRTARGEQAPVVATKDDLKPLRANYQLHQARWGANLRNSFNAVNGTFDSVVYTLPTSFAPAPNEDILRPVSNFNPTKTKYL